MAKSAFEKGWDVAQDVALITVGQALTEEGIDVVMGTMTEDGEQPSFTSEVIVKSAAPFGIGLAAAGTMKQNRYVKNIAIGAMATAAVNGVQLTIRKVKEAGKEAEDTMEGLRQLAAVRQRAQLRQQAARQLPAARMVEERQEESGYLSGGGRTQYQAV